MGTFFGLTSEYKKSIHDEIFFMVTHGNGGWSWETVYTLPIFLRRYYREQLVKMLTRDETQNTSAGKIHRPDIMRK